MKAEDLKVLVLVPNYWGSGDSLSEAWANVKLAGYSGRKGSKPYAALVVSDDFMVNGVDGSVSATFAKKIEEVK